VPRVDAGGDGIADGDTSLHDAAPVDDEPLGDALGVLDGDAAVRG
jgi:hypothetical protein